MNANGTEQAAADEVAADEVAAGPERGNGDDGDERGAGDEGRTKGEWRVPPVAHRFKRGNRATRADGARRSRGANRGGRWAATSRRGA